MTHSDTSLLSPQKQRFTVLLWIRLSDQSLKFRPVGHDMICACRLKTVCIALDFAVGCCETYGGHTCGFGGCNTNDGVFDHHAFFEGNAAGFGGGMQE
jgi:hypothetical protein